MGKHPHKEIRKALVRAEHVGLTVRELSGHTWGRITCPTCGETTPVYSTPRNPETGARKLHRFVDRHSNHEETP